MNAKFDIKQCTSEQLADLLIGNRYLGFFKDITSDVMKELSERRLNGDAFDYEKYIEENISTLPDIKFDTKPSFDVTNLFKNLKKILK